MVAASEEGFDGYIPQTVDPGNTLLISSIIFCILMTIMLPILVSIGDLHDKKKKSQLELQEQQQQQTQLTTNGGELAPSPAVVGRNVNIVESGDASWRSSADDSILTPVSQIQSTVSDLISHPRIRGQAGRHKRRGGRRTIMMLQQMDKDSAAFLTQYPPGQHDANNLSIEVPIDGHPFDDQASLSPSDENIDKLSALSSSKGSSSSTSESDDESSRRTIQEDQRQSQKVSCIDCILDIAMCDHEMKRIFQLGVPFAVQALVTAILEIAVVGVIGNLLGTKELSAAVVVSMCLEFTADTLGGIQESLTTLCSQAIGARNFKLAGQYVQLSIILYILFSIPFMFFWGIFIGPTTIWLGFDEETAQIGTDYAYILIVDLFVINGVWESIHGLLDVMGKERYSMILAIAEELTALVVIFVAAAFGNPTLQDIGYIELAIGTAFLAVNIGYITWKGWFRKYLPGLLGSFSLRNTKAVCLMAQQSLSLSFGLLLTEGEWEILAVFASFLGPAEVVVWGVLGALWGSIEALIESIGDAAEVRCAFLLGAGMPLKAKLSAYKANLIGVYSAFVIVSVTLICGEDIPKWLTSDPTLQHMLADLLPLFAVGCVALTIGSICWTLIGAQGRYRLATTVVLFGSIFFTLPAAAIFSVALNINLQGQMTAVIMGYMVSGTVNAYFLFRTDWEATSRRVIQQNADETSSSSSSSSSSASRKPSKSAKASGSTNPSENSRSSESLKSSGSSKPSERSKAESKRSSNASAKQSSLSSGNSLTRSEITALASKSSLLQQDPTDQDTLWDPKDLNVDDFNSRTSISSVTNIGCGFFSNNFETFETNKGLELILQSFDDDDGSKSTSSGDDSSATTSHNPSSFLEDLL